MKSWTFSALLGLSLMSGPGSLKACLWDRDTIRIEALAHLEVVQTAAGWFDRNPPLYYQMRLDRVSKLLETTPESLDLYDDAAVACERLGRQDDAIAWMAKKKAQLGDKLQSEHGYRYLSNLGTFYLHRWIINKDHGHQRDDLRQAISLITEALKVNPDAHFGRERVQLALMRWLLEGYEHPDSQGFGLSNFVDPEHRESLDYTKGLCGLVQMGFAWESVDVFFWLAKEAEKNRNMLLSVFVRERIAELAASGHISLFPWDLSNAVTTVPGELPLMQLLQVDHTIREPGEKEKAVHYFKTFRAAADARDRQRTEFMTARLRQGMHPDTHPDFWTGWASPSMPPPPADPFLKTYLGTHWDSNIVALVFAVVCGLLIFYIIRLMRRLPRSV